MNVLTTPSGGTLALDGGVPVRTGPLPTWPIFDQEDAALAGKVLLSNRVNYWTGEEGRSFEREFAAWAEADHAVALSNGTVALEIVLRGLGVGPGDEVIVPSATFVATASAVVACGATPIVVDIDPDSQALTADTVEPAITTRTVAVVVVHVGGYPADTDPLVALTSARGLALVEDCAQAHGARRAGRMVGTSGRAAAWSFCQDKIMTTAGEGGAITTSDSALWRWCWEYKDHGKNHATVHSSPSRSGFRWLHDSFGTNARMTEIQASIGRRQLTMLPTWLAARRAHAERLRGALVGIPALRIPTVAPGVEHAYYRFYCYTEPDLLRPGWDRDRVLAALNAEGIAVGSGGCTEIHRERAFRALGPQPDLPVARELGLTAIALPVHPAMDDKAVTDIAEAVQKVFDRASA